MLDAQSIEINLAKTKVHMKSNTRINLTVQNISEIHAGLKKNIMEKCIFLAVANGKQNESKILGSSCPKLLPITASNLQ